MFINGSASLFFVFCLMILCTACQQKQATNDHLSSLRISCESDPESLDPRQVRELATVTVIHMLYEGLMRNQSDGQPTPALAETVSISPDQKTYMFKIRQSMWSDGQPVTAQDFEETWKSILNPEFPSPNAYQLYVIKNAQAAKEGLTTLDQVGVKATDSNTLIVELEHPTAHFLQLVASHFYYPVHASLRMQKSSSINFLNESTLATNGPFILENWKRHNELTAVPNPHYWDHKNVNLDRISLIVLDNSTALQMFQRGDLDWTGSPLSTLSTDSLGYLRQKGQLHVKPSAGVYLLRLNVERPPFNDIKIRQAFALALNRADLVEHVLQGNQTPAYGIIPASFIHLQKEPLFQDSHIERAKQLFNEALNDQGITLERFPPIVLSYATGERPHKVAQVVRQQWKQIFDVHVDLQSCESKAYFDCLKRRDYQVGIGSWFADIRDPISFLDIFKLKENGTNNTQWENPHYIALLDQSSQTTDSKQREQLLMEAEKVLVHDMPVIPLFHNSYNYVCSPAINDVYFSELGYLDFKHAKKNK